MCHWKVIHACDLLTHLLGCQQFAHPPVSKTYMTNRRSCPIFFILPWNINTKIHGGGGGEGRRLCCGKLHGFALLWAGNGCVWGRQWLCLGQATAVFGAGNGCVWGRQRLCLGQAMAMFGAGNGCVWGRQRLCLGQAKAVFGAGNGCVWGRQRLCLGQATALLCDYIRFSLCLNWDKLLKNVNC